MPVVTVSRELGSLVTQIAEGVAVRFDASCVDKEVLAVIARQAGVPVEEIAGYWIDRLERMLNALVRDRDVIGPDRSVDIRFDDFMAGELGVAERVYALAGEPFSDAARAAITGYLAGHQRGRLGTVATSAEMFGLAEDDLRDRFAPYVERFLK